MTKNYLTCILTITVICTAIVTAVYVNAIHGYRRHTGASAPFYETGTGEVFFTDDSGEDTIVHGEYARGVNDALDTISLHDAELRVNDTPGMNWAQRFEIVRARLGVDEETK